MEIPGFAGALETFARDLVRKYSASSSGNEDPGAADFGGRDFTGTGECGKRLRLDTIRPYTFLKFVSRASDASDGFD